MTKKDTVSGYKLVFGYLGAMLLVIGVVLLLPLLILFTYPEEICYAYCFVVPSIPCFVVGYILMKLIRNKDTAPLNRNHDAIIVVFSWLLLIFLSAIPFILTKNFTFIQAVFESTSAYTTTGLSVMNSDSLPRIFLLFRSIGLFIGGVGLILVVSTVLSSYYGMRLYGTEGHSEKLLPNVIKTSRLILSVYSLYILLGTLAFIYFGMDWFDAINHAIAALSTGGFSTKSAGISYFNSIPIELVAISLMLLGGTGFLIHVLITKLNFKKVLLHCETKFNIFLFFTVIPFFCFSLCQHFNFSILHSLRITLFNVVSAVTTTGFQTIPKFPLLPPSLFLCLIILMLIGGNTGSTSGGIKQYRMIIILKEMWWNILDKTSFRRIVRVYTVNKYGENEAIDQYEKRKVSSFIFLYLFIFLIATFIFTCFGHSISNSMFEVASALSGTGISSGIISSSCPTPILLTTCACMLLGRLEIYVIILSFLRIFMDLRHRKQLS
ncbi:MAG: TrkH family potassium uptake protein [Clostridiales bacterium]|nr:TrkH family potassium uptake protein [Clostridiales bacterium]